MSTTAALRIVTAMLLGASLLAALAVGAQDTTPDPKPRLALVTTSSSSSTTTTIAAPTPTLGPVGAPPTAPLPPPSIPTDARVVISPKGVVVTVVRAEGTGWVVRTPCGNTVHLAEGRPVSSSAIVLDAGHGGSEPGATSPDKAVTEAKVNLGVAREAAKALELQGYTVVLTRTADYRMTLEARAAVVLALQPRAFVSIHHNAEPDGPRDIPGSETYYQHASPDSKRLAGLLYEEIVRTLDIYDVPWVGDNDAGAKYRRNSVGDDYYGILRRPKGVPSVLAELAFISNQPEADLVNRADVQRVEGDAIARGIVRYLTTNDPGSGYVEGYTRTSPAGSGGGNRGCVDPPLH